MLSSYQDFIKENVNTEKMECYHAFLGYVYYNDSESASELARTPKSIRKENYKALLDSGNEIIYRGIVLEKSDYILGKNLEKNEFELSVSSWTTDKKHAVKVTKNHLKVNKTDFKEPILLVLSQKIDSSVIIYAPYYFKEIKKYAIIHPDEFDELDLYYIQKMIDNEQEVICDDIPFKLNEHNHEIVKQYIKESKDVDQQSLHIQSELEKKYPSKFVIQNDHMITFGFNSNDIQIDGIPIRVKFHSPSKKGDTPGISWCLLNPDEIERTKIKKLINIVSTINQKDFYLDNKENIFFIVTERYSLGNSKYFLFQINFDNISPQEIHSTYKKEDIDLKLISFKKYSKKELMDYLHNKLNQ